MSRVNKALVNARLFISVDVWYKHLPNNTAVLIFGANKELCLTKADILRLTTMNRNNIIWSQFYKKYTEKDLTISELINSTLLEFRLN